MKTRSRTTASSAVIRRRFALHPLSFAICMAMSGAALALPQGGKVVAGDATIGTPSKNYEVVKQTTDKAIIDWQSFSIAAGEKVRFYQPSSTSVTLNRVVGYDPSKILGQMSSNGKIFLINPHGVIFGEGARIDVGGLVVSSLSMSDSDFLASRYNLTSVDPSAPAERGEVRNDGTINAPGGLVVLAGPTVTNTGTIVANGGRVGLVAANSVSVDVEGDGLIFFQANATEAKNRLQQLGRIQADGGTVEMRAEARGAFADTVLNMSGVVQARSLGDREGRIVIDGGSDGIVAVSGQLDASGRGMGERGGQVTVEGQRVLLDNGSVVDASGDAGGGTIRVGGDFHGANPEVRDSQATGIAPGATLRADALDNGDGGKIAIWSDGVTRYYGQISAEGGKNGGDGGFVEVSGKQELVFRGDVSTLAPKGKRGTLLLDPTDITIANTNNSADDGELDADQPTAGDPAGLVKATDGAATSFTISATKLETIGNTNSIDLEATNSIAIADLTTPFVAVAHQLTLNGGNATFKAGNGGISVAGTTTIDVTNGSLTIDATAFGSGPVQTNGLQAKGAITLKGSSVTLNGPIDVTVAGAGVAITGPTTLGAGGGSITLTGNNAANDVVLGAVDGAQTLAITASGGDVTLGAVGAGTTLTGVTINSATAALQNVRSDGNQTYNAAISAAAITLDAGTGSISANNASNDFTGALTLKASGASIAVHDANDLTLAAPTLGNTSLTVVADGVLTLPAAAINAGTGSINLQSLGGTLATGGTLTSNGGSVSLVGSAGLSVTDDIATAGGNVSLTAGGGSGIAVSSGKSVNAGAGTIGLDGGTKPIQLNDSTLTTTNAGAGAVTIRDASTVAIGNITAASGTVQVGVGGDVKGAVTQTAGTTLAADTLAASTSTAAGTIDLGSAGTLTIANLGNVQRGDALTIADSGAGLTLTGDVTGGTANSAVSISTANGTLALGAHGIATGGTGTLTLSGDAITQSTGALVVGGATSVTANSGSIGLLSPNNDFTGAVDLSATGSAAIQTANALNLNSFAGNGITAIAGTTLSVPAGAITTTGGAIDLEALGGSLATSGNLTSNGGSITLVGATGLSVANDLASGGGAISLKGGGAGGLVVTATHSVNAGAGTIAIDASGKAIDLHQSTLTTTNASPAAVTIRDATTVAIGNVTATSGTVQIGVGGDVSALVSQTAGTTLAANVVAASTSGAITLGTAGTLTVADLGNVQRGGALTIVDSGALALTGDVTAGTVSNAVSITATGGVLDLGSHNITTSGANNLTLTGAGVTQTTGSLIVGGATAVNAGAGSIALQSITNDFTGAVTLSASGTDAAVRDGNNLTLGALAGVGATTNLTAIAGGTLSLPATTFTTSGSIDLRSLGGTLSTNGALNAANISLTGSAGLTIADNLVATNAVTLASTNSTISESAGATITAGGATSFNAGSGTVTLAQDNTLGSIGGTGGAVSITEGSANGVALDAINASSLGVTTTAAGASVSQNFASTVTGATSVTTNGGNVLLTNPGNNFGSVGANAAGAAVSITDVNALGLDAISAAALNVNTSAGNGAVTQNAAALVTGTTGINAGSGAVTLGRAGNAFGSIGVTGGAVSLTEGSANGVALDPINAASLSVTTLSPTGNVTQNGPAIVAGATAITTSGGNVALTDPGNNFGSVGVAAAGAAVSITNVSALALDAITASTLTLDTSAGNGAITQNAAAVVSNATVVTAGNGSIALNNPGNDFSNGPGNSFSGGGIAVRDANALTITTLAAGANQSVSVVAGGALTMPIGAINTGTGDLTLSSGGPLATPGTLTGNNVSLTGAAGVTIGNDITATGSLTLATTNAPVNQTSGTIIAGPTSVTAGTGAVTLAQPLDNFSSINIVSGGNVQVADVGGLGLAAAASGTLTVDTTGVLTSTGAIGGTNVLLTGNAGISLGNNVVAGGTLGLVSANNAITQTGGAISATGGLTTVNAGGGDITLSQAGNDFSNVAGINATGGAVRLADANALVIAGLVNGANKDLSLVAGTTISGVGGNIDTGSADLTISAGSGFTTFGTLRGTNVTVGGGVGGISISQDITALGNLNLNTTNTAINQIGGTISAAGTTTANAGSGSITLAQAGNNFATFGATGGAVSVVDANGLVLGATSASTLTIDSSAGNGAITQTGPAVVTGATAINAGSGAVTLANAGNNFASIGVTGGAVAITDSNAVVLNAINATSLAVNTSAGNGTVTQTVPLIVTGATSVNAGSGAVTLASAANNFGSFGATGGAVTVTDVNALALDAVNATSLNVTAGGALTQNAAVVVGGATVLNAGANAITLNNAGNDFASVAATGGAVTLRNSNALALGPIAATTLTVDTSAGNGAVTQTGAAVVAGATLVSAGTGAVTLNNAGNNFASVAVSGGAVTIKDVDAVTLGAISASSLGVDTSAGNGAVTQTGAAIVSGASVVNAGSGAVTLANAGNDFGSLGVTGGAVTVVDSNALTLTSLSSGANQAVSVNAGGALTLPATAIDTGSAALALTSGGTLTSVGTLRGTNVALASGGAMAIANNVTSLGTLSLTSGNAPIAQSAGAIVASGAATVNAGSGDVTLAQPGNDFQANLALTGGAVSVRDVNNLTVSSLTSGANRPVSLIAGGSLVLPGNAIDTGSADLTLQALGGSLVINSALSGNNVTLTGSAGLTLGANITSSGDQIYTTAVQLSGNVALNAGASRIDLQGGANGGGNNLSLSSTSAAANAIHTGAPITNTAQFTVNGNSTLGGNVTTTGNQTYAGPVVLGTDVSLAAGAAKIDLQGAVDAGGHNLGLTSGNAAADAIDAQAVIGNAAQLTVTGKSTLASGVTTTGAQVYTDTVTLGSNSNFSGSSLGFGNGIVAGTFDLGLQSDALSVTGTVSGSGNATLSSSTQGATVGIAGGAGTYQVSQTEINGFSTFGSLSIGRADGTGDITVGNLVLPTNLALRSASGNANFTGTVASAAGQSRDLSVSSGGLTTFAGNVGGAIGGGAALGNLSVAGATHLDANATSNGAQSFGGNVTVGADATLSAGAVAFGGALDVGTHTLTAFTDAFGIAGAASGSGPGSIRLAPQSAAGSIGVAGAAGTLQVSQGLLDTLSGIPTLTLGRADSTAAVSVGNVVLPADLAISNGSGSVTFTGTVDSAAGPTHNLAVSTTGVTSFAGAVGATRLLNTLTVDGASQLGSTVATSGAQTYTGAATLTADSTLTAPSVGFGSTVDGAHALTVDAAATSFGGAVGGVTVLTSLSTDAAGTTQLGGNVTTSGAQIYNDALLLNADAALSASTLHLGGGVDGAHALNLAGSGGVVLAQAIGATTPLVSLSVTGPLQLDAGAVTTSGAQSYAGPVVLGAATTLSAASIAFGSSLDGAFGLALQSAGTTSFASAVGATTPLASLAVGGGGTVQLTGASIETSGAQSFSGALVLAGATRLTGSALTLDGPVSGATDLTLQTNALNGAASMAGSGTLTIAPLDPTLSIGIAGGAGGLQVSQAMLDGASSFAAHAIGRSDGSGTVSAGNVVLRADTTLQTASGDIDLGGSVDGGFALTLNSGGTTRIAGPIGATTPLKSLTTDNNAAASDWNGTSGERTTFDTADGTGTARVITTGAQTYNDPLTASVPIAFSGGAITATQASNRFDGTVSAVADSLQLHSSADLQLATITLGNGGAIDTDGVLHLTGVLQLNGGTLVLTANATPTPIDITDPELQGKPLTFGFVPIKEASATIVEDAGATLGSAAGSLIAFRSPNGGTLQLDQPGNTLLGNISAVSGKLGDNDLSRFNNANVLMLGFIRIASSEIHVAGAPPTDGDQTLAAAGLEGDVIKLTADVLTTGADGLIRARLPFNNVQGSQTSVPGVTFVLSPTALAKGGGFGGSTPDTFIRIQVGGPEGGFITADPKGVGGENAVIFLGGNVDVRPFYDQNGKLTEIRIFYNGDAPRTPQEAGALAAVIALIEEARHARFEEAVRTENVSSRLRSGVIAEVGAGRPATVGRESIRLPETCDVKAGTLRCE